MDIFNHYYYSERGIVHSIIEDMSEGTTAEQKEKAKGFLDAIKFVDTKNNPFRNVNIESIDFIEEPSFSEFGDPDLIVVVNKRIVIFIEAKLATYQKAAVKSPDPQNMSKVNVQLALKYRFWKAYNESRADSTIEEKTSDNYMFEKDKMRRLKNSFVLDNYVKPSFNNSQEDAYFVALTNDAEDVKAGVVIDSDYKPPIVEWNNEKTRFGLLTYKSLERRKVVSKDINTKYGFASKILDTAAAEGWRDFDIVVRTKKLKESEYLKKPIFNGMCSVKEHEGSYSIVKSNGETIGKIFEYNGKLYAGVTEKKTLEELECENADARYVFNGHLFDCREITDVKPDDPDNTEKAIRKVLLEELKFDEKDFK